MPIFKFQEFESWILRSSRRMTMFVCLLFLVGCSSQSWEDFIPKSEAQLREQGHSQAELGNELESQVLDNGQTFPDDCDWQPLARVVDGDTLVLESDIRVRFIGIDTPETKHPSKGVEPFGLQASEMTKDLLANSAQVCLMESEVGDKYDKYGRKLAYVFSEFGVDVNAELLRLGLAKGYFNFPFDRKEKFKMIEEQAREERRNIWQ